MLPAVVPALAVLLGAAVSTVMQSVGLVPLVGEPRFTVSAYVDTAPDLLRGALLSVGIATTATVLAAAIGTAAALLVAGPGPGGRVLAAAGGSTIPVPHLVGAAAIGLLLADSGLLPRLLGVLPESWPALVGGPWWIAVVAEYAWKESAFVALVVAGALATRVASYTETAAVLGAGPWRRLRHVTLPLAAPALVASSAISFAYAVGSYEVAWLLGRAYPEPLPVLAYRLFTSLDLAARPQAAAVALTTTVLAGAAGCGGLAVLRRTAAR